MAPHAPLSTTAHQRTTQNHLQSYALDGSVDLRGRPVLRSSTGRWKACFFVIGVELIERVAYYGIASNLVTYLTDTLREDTASAAKNTNNWSGVTSAIPVLGAFLADAYWGRYWTITASSIIYVVGLVLLTLSVSLKTLRPASCSSGSLTCPKATSAQLGFFFFSLYLISFGTGGIKPCLEAFGADQFDEQDPSEMMKRTSFFNWWYFGLCTGALLASTVLVYVQDNVGWALGFGLPAGAMVIALCVFLLGTPFYRHKLPGGSPLTRVAQVVVAAIRKWNVQVLYDEALLYEMHDEKSLRVGRRRLLHTQEFRCLDKAAVVNNSRNGVQTGQISSPGVWHRAPQVEENTLRLLDEAPAGEQHSDGNGEEGLSVSPWKLCTVTQVEEVKLVVRIVPVFLATLVYGIVFAQVSTLFTKQGSTMDRRVGSFKIPAASLQAFTALMILLLVPLYEHIFAPAARYVTGNERGITLLQRIGVGLFFSAVSTAVAALVEMKRLRAAREFGLLDGSSKTIPMSIFWLLPQYLLFGAADVFTIVGEQEFFYDQMPDTMRSLGLAVYLLSLGVGSFLSSLLITVVERVTTMGGHQNWFVSDLNRCHLDYFYWLLALLSLLNLIAYIWVAKAFHYKKAEHLSHAIHHL